MEAGERVALRRNRSFVLLSASLAVRGLAFWLCWLGMLALASFTLKASPGQIALVTAATSLPHILLSPFAGTIVDRSSPRTVLAVAYIWNAGIGLALVLSTEVWHLYPISFLWSLSGSFVWPAMGSILKGLVADRDLTRANGFLHSMWEATLVVGPLAGAALSTISPRAPMAVGGAISLMSAALILLLRVDVARAAKPEKGKGFAELREGISLMLRLPDLRALALWGAGAWAGFNVLIAVEPVFVRDFLHGGQSMLNAFYSVGGIGSTLGALAIGWFAFSRFELRTAALGLVLCGVCFALYIGIARWPHVLPIQAFIGMGFAVYQTTSQSLITRRAPQHVVGRALAAKRQVEEIAGFASSLVAGAVAASVGTRTTMIASGGLMTLGAIALLVRSIRFGPSGDAPAAVAVPPDEPLGVDPVHDLGSPPPV